MADPSPPVVDRRFVLESEHKRGGMGTVWRARDLDTARSVAVKILHSPGTDQIERFMREARMLSELAHASIVGYIAHGTTGDGVPYLAMEWLDGENAAERLARQPLSLSESLTLVRGAARGLAFAHRAGIVHRDLKPSNLFLRGGRLDDVVLLDLGIARHVGRAAQALTRTGSILGTPSYMAPEQAQGHADVGPAADVFSLGCVLFECLTGDPPFLGTHLFAVLAKVLFDETPRVRDLRPEVPPAVDALIDRMLMKDPARRLPDAAALVAAIGGLGVLPEVEPPGASRAPARPTPSEQELVSVILATAGSVVTDGAAGGEPTLPSGDLVDASLYSGEQRRLADGTTLITLPQRGGAATDLAIRAARCALRVRERWPGWHIVLATGRGVARERIHIGDAVDRAGTMLRARADSSVAAICLDEVTAGLLDARFRTRSLADGLFLLEDEDPSIDPTRRLLGRPTACVGREQELGTLELALHACVDDSTPRAVMVVGPPGIGKSRLRHELLRRIQAQGRELLVLLGQGDPIRSSTTSGLLGGAVARLCGIRAGADDDESRAALEARVGRRLGEQARRTTVFMGELCGVRYPAETLAELRAARQNPRIMADFIAQAWLAFLRAEAAAQPVLLVLDDLQWSDALTVSLVDAALRELDASPVLVLALARPEIHEIFPEIWSPRLASLPLRPLGSSVTTRFVRQVLGDAVGDDTVDRIVSRAAGNALYLEELIRAAEAHRDTVPETVVAMLQARIGLLPPALRRVLRTASIFGESFPVAGLAALGADEDLQAGLAALGKHEILEEQAGETERWRFRHVLMRDAAYGLLTDEDRRASHALAARFLEAAGEDPAVIAAHCERGGDRAGAVHHYIAAANHALRRIDHAATLELVRRGRAAGAAGEELGILSVIEGQTMVFRYDFAAASAKLAEALALLPPDHPRRIQSVSSGLFCAMLLGKSTEVDAAVEELAATRVGKDDRADVVAALGWASISQTATGHREATLRLLGRIGEIEAAADEADALVHGTARYWQTRFHELLGDEPYGCWRTALDAVRLCRISGDRRMLAATLGSAGECARRLSLVADGAAAMREAVGLAEKLNEPILVDHMRSYLAGLLVERGAPDDLAEGRELARTVVAAAAPGSPYHALGSLALARALLEDGDLEAAEATARSGRDTIRALGMRSYYPYLDGVLLQVLAARGSAEAGALADEALATVVSLGPMGLIDVPLRLRAALALVAVGRSEDAGRVVADALALLARQAAAIPDPALRRRFLDEVPENAMLAALGRKFLASPP